MKITKIEDYQSIYDQIKAIITTELGRVVHPFWNDNSLCYSINRDLDEIAPRARKLARLKYKLDFEQDKTLITQHLYDLNMFEINNILDKISKKIVYAKLKYSSEG